MTQCVLVVDDSPVIRTVVRIHLMGRTFQFLEAGSGLEALEIIRARSVDLVIADINMPGLDGISLVRALRADPRPALQRLPVILLTSESGEDTRARGLDAGANAFVQKPVSSAHLIGVVGQVLPPAR